MNTDDIDNRDFIIELNRMAERIHALATEKGWWKGEGTTDGEKIALMHSELSEALEGVRHGNPLSDKIPEFTVVEEELADTIIRILDFGYKHDHRIAAAIIAKHEYNKNRSYRHGGKKL